MKVDHVYHVEWSIDEQEHRVRALKLLFFVDIFSLSLRRCRRLNQKRLQAL